MFKYIINFSFISIFSLAGISGEQGAYAMKAVEESHEILDISTKINKRASLYVDFWNNSTEDQEQFMKNMTNLFYDSYPNEKLKEFKDIKYSVLNFLPNFSMFALEIMHIPFLNKFLKEEDILEVENKAVRKSLMLMSHDIRVAEAVQTLEERGTISEAIENSIGKLYLVMFNTGEQEREVIGSGTGTFVKNDINSQFILSCAHFPPHMEKYNDLCSFEMYMFPHFLLDERNEPQGTEKSKIPFDQYSHLKINKIIFPSGTEVKLNLKDMNNIDEDSNIILSSDEIPNIRFVKEGRKDFACFMQEPIDRIVPMLFESFSSYKNKDLNFFAAGYPSWGLSDNTFAIVKGKKVLQKNQWSASFTFPALHGMSGGPVFIFDNSKEKYIITCIITGVDEKTLKSTAYPLFDSVIEDLENIQ